MGEVVGGTINFILSLWPYLLFIFLIALSGFFSSSETALTSLKKVKLVELEEKDAHVIKYLKKWFEKPNEYLTTILLGNNIVNVGSTTLATILTIKLIKNLHFLDEKYAAWAVTFGMTIILLIFGEITPKIIAKSNANGVSVFVIRPITAIKFLFTRIIPLVPLFIFISKSISKMLPIDVDDENLIYTDEEIKNHFESFQEDGAIEKQEAEMMSSIVDFGDRLVRDVMIPRTSMYALEGNKTLNEIWDELIENGFSRVPVYDDSRDDIKGLLYLKDLIKLDRNESGNDKIIDYIREAYFVPKGKSLIHLLEDFKLKKIHMAIVVDEYGGTLGLITIEDVIEEIIGEIQDEFDEEEEDIQEINNNLYVVDGKTSIEKINEELDLDIEISEEYETIAGYIHTELGRVAEEGDKIKKENFTIIASKLDNHKIIEVKIIKKMSDNSNKKEDIEWKKENQE